ncbi:MAG: DUF924 domain-containing protein [Alphaproteobacteria bacterium]|nr:DUF924 domain-containing protein [Alphaproteobacteria bacterium SS10]
MQTFPPDPRFRALLSFWFDELTMEDWFKRSDAVDDEIRRRFTPLLPFAQKGSLHSWRDSLDSVRALLILLDQVPRNCFRDDATAFAYDRLAQSLALFTLERYADELASLGPFEMLFVLLPLEHAEDLDLQNRCVQLFDQFADRYSGEDAEHWVELTEYARRHHAPIEKFGRFPHRNAVLGRETTKAEAAWLEEKPGGF